MKILRRCSFLAVPLLMFASPSAQSEPPETSPFTVTVKCDNRYISQVDAARVMHTDNFSQTYAKRQTLRANVARLCQTGISQIGLIAQEPQPNPRSNVRTVASR